MEGQRGVQVGELGGGEEDLVGEGAMAAMPWIGEVCGL